MTTSHSQISAWGNGLALRLTKPMAKTAGVTEGTPVRVVVEPGRIKLDRAVSLPHPRHYSVKTTPEFTQLKAELTEQVRVEVRAAQAAMAARHGTTSALRGSGGFARMCLHECWHGLELSIRLC